MTTSDIISRGTLIYSSIEKDENLRTVALQKRSCEVSYYSIHSLTPVDEVILGILMAEPENSLSIDSLGTTLGFDVINSPLEGKFYDEAENNIFVNLVERDTDIRYTAVYVRQLGTEFRHFIDFVYMLTG